MQNLEKITIDLQTQDVKYKSIISEWERWGGRTFTSRTIYEKVPFSCDPLGKDNILVISTGLLAGSGASSTYRISIGAKSPLTGGIKEANSGGMAGYALSVMEIRGILLTEFSYNWVYLLIKQYRVEFIPADEFIGADIFQTTAALRSKHGDKSVVISIGPAREKLYRSACIGITDPDGIPSRHAARGGLGAVMGSKKVKAIVIDSAGLKRPLFEKQTDINSANKRFATALLNHPTTGKVLPKFGTAIIVDTMQALGGLPTYNFSSGTFNDAKQINGEALYNMIVERGGKPTHACMPGCVIRCSNIIPSKQGNEINRALEYEAIVLLGFNCGINDLDTICKLNHACDALGLDTIETGAAIGVAMEAGLLPFGDCEKTLLLMEEIAKSTPTGEMIANGADETGKKLNVKRVPTVKGQSMAAYDPRTIKGTGVTYATSPMGADHTAGNVLPGTKMPDGTVPDCSHSEYQIELSRYIQLFATIFDYLGLCWLAKPPIFDDFTLVLDILNAMHEGKWQYDDLFDLSREVLNMELEFNYKAGLSMTNDLPNFFREEPLSPNNYVFDIDYQKLQSIHHINDFNQEK